MLLLADENFPYSSFKYLKEQGYDIKHIGESDMGIKDEEVIQLSIDEGRVITTFDSDFGELIFKHSLRNGDKTNLHFWLDLFASGVVDPA